jgi:hydroxypyruvate isomerase
MNRRDFLAASAATLAAGSKLAAEDSPIMSARKTGRLKQCAMRANFDPKMPFEDCVREAAKLGMYGVDMAGQNDWPTLKKYGMICSMGATGGVEFENGIIHKDLHEKLEKSVGENLDLCAANGIPSMISVGGKKKTMSYEEGADNAVAFLNRIKARAEDKQVNFCIEIMNSKFKDALIGREDQICDHFAWAMDVIKRVNSPRVKILFDIYHVQIMDGDVVRKIRDNIQYIGHFHTGGVPDRHELDDTQELNYRFIAKAIADTGYQGYIAHEFRPSAGRDPIASLKQAIEIMNV